LKRAIEFIRELDASELGRSHWEGRDEEGGRWLFEAVHLPDGSRAVVRQVHAALDGTARRYSWEHIEDDDGGLTDQALDIHAEWIESISPDRFLAAWRNADE
jgi:hypothetical protein